MQRVLKMRGIKLATVTAAVVILSGCAVDKEGCDPAAMRTAGFFSKMSCDFSGSYQARAQDQQVQLEEAKRQRELLQGTVSQLEDENRRLNEGITLKRAERDRLARSLNSTLDAIAQENAQNKAVIDQIQKARLEVDRLKNLPDNANPAIVQTRIKAVQDEIANLNNQVGFPSP